jgi:hypothetical protein
MYNGVAIKKNEIMLIAGEWMELEVIILSEISQCQKAVFKKSIFTCFHSYIESRFKMIKITIIMRFEGKSDIMWGLSG